MRTRSGRCAVSWRKRKFDTDMPAKHPACFRKLEEACMSVCRRKVRIYRGFVSSWLLRPIRCRANPELSNRPKYLGETIKPEAGESFDWHAHDYGQLISAESGSMTVGTPDRVLLLSPAMAVWIPPDMDHWMRYGPNDVMIYVDVDRQEADRLGWCVPGGRQ